MKGCKQTQEDRMKALHDFTLAYQEVHVAWATVKDGAHELLPQLRIALRIPVDQSLHLL